MSKAVILFSGFNQRAVISFLRTLETSNVEYAIIASSPDDSIFLSKYKKQVFSTRIKRELDLEDILNSIEVSKQRLAASEYLIAPSTEALNRFLLKNRPVFNSVGCSISLPEERLYETVSDKYSFGEVCGRQGITMPREYKNIDEIRVPCVIKPKKYVSSDGKTHSPNLIKTKNELMDFRKTHEIKDFYFQEYVGGDSLYLLYYFYKNRTVMKYSQQNLMQQPGGKSVIAAVSSDFHESPESEKYEQLFNSIKFTGLVMVEVKFFHNSYYMIEANPRFWGPSQLFVDAGVNCFEAFLYDNGVIEDRPKTGARAKKVKYFWYGGLMELEVNNGKVAYHSYSQREYTNEKMSWLHNDVYNRSDTVGIYINELRKNNESKE